MQILLAEDDRISRDLLRRIIESEAQHSLTLAADGEEAWAHLEDPNQRFDVCILDICMPGMSGLDLLERIRASESLKDMAVIFCTAVHDRTTVQRAGQLGITHYIVKPYSRTLMVEKLRQIKTTQGELEPLEASPIVGRRLGIDADMHRVMIESLVEDVNEWCEKLRAATELTEVQKLFIRGRGIKGSCLSLGARRIAQELTAIESLLQINGSAGAPAVIPLARIQGPLANLAREVSVVEERIRAVA